MSRLDGVTVSADVEGIVAAVTDFAAAHDRVVVMSNGGFHGIHELLEQALRRKFANA
jgi:UDP-N-acetylmuramate-alanine ligase